MCTCRGEGEEKGKDERRESGKEVEREKMEEERRFLKTQRYPPSLSCGSPHQEYVWNFPNHPHSAASCPWRHRLGGEVGAARGILEALGCGVEWPSSTLLEARLCICEVFPLICTSN